MLILWDIGQTMCAAAPIFLATYWYSKQYKIINNRSHHSIESTKPVAQSGNQLACLPEL
jgi:hypothetical protein